MIPILLFRATMFSLFLNMHIFNVIAIQHQRNLTALDRSLGVSRRASKEVTELVPSVPNPTAHLILRATRSLAVNPLGPNPIRPQRRSKTNRSGRKTAWQMWRRYKNRPASTLGSISYSQWKLQFSCWLIALWFKMNYIPNYHRCGRNIQIFMVFEDPVAADKSLLASTLELR